MPTDSPLISVIIPVLNGERFLAAAIDSIRLQHVAPLEIIVIDDGSTDRTAALVSTLGDDIRYLFQTNQGPSAARNAGLRMANGEIIAFLDADDIWPANRLSLLLKRLQKEPSLEIVLGRLQFTGQLTEAERKMRFEGPDNVTMSLSLGSGIYKESVFSKVGLFDERLFHYEDYEWFMRARENDIPIVILKDVTYIYQKRPDSLIRQQDPQARHLIRIFKMSLDRRRQQHQGQLPVIPGFFDFDEEKNR
jgi:glycosyltransferase involved in cell wall biosynthesis